MDIYYINIFLAIFFVSCGKLSFPFIFVELCKIGIGVALRICKLALFQSKFLEAW